MDDRKFKFLRGVLGLDGAMALTKAAERSSHIGSALLPRTILAWLGVAARSDYEGDLPGVDNTYIQFAKSEDHYTGSISIGEVIYSFEKANLYHLAASIAVALGSDHEGIPPALRDLDIQRLGKNIDTLAKARVAIAELKRQRTSPEELFKAIAEIPAGAQVGTGGQPPNSPGPGHIHATRFDYSHVLSPAHKKAGYSLHVSHNPVYGTMTGHLKHGPLEVGSAKAHVGDVNRHAMSIQDAEIAEPHQGKGLGQHMYEALMAHGYHKLGMREMAGSIHSSMASRVHAKLSSKHGLDYKAAPTPAPQLADQTPGPYDARHGPYNYTIKDEMPMAKKGPTGGAEAPGPAHAPTAPLGPLTATPADPTQDSKGPTLPKVQKPQQLPKIPKIPKIPKLKPIKIGKSQAERKCNLCDIAQMKAGKFVGCFCFRDLAKHTQATPDGDGYTLEFKAEWDQESILTLLESLGE